MEPSLSLLWNTEKAVQADKIGFKPTQLRQTATNKRSTELKLTTKSIHLPQRRKARKEKSTPSALAFDLKQ